MEVSLRNTHFVNTAACWQIRGPFSIELRPSYNISRLDGLPGVVVEGRMVTIKIGTVQYLFNKPHFWVTVGGGSFQLAHEDVRMISDQGGIVSVLI